LVETCLRQGGSTSESARVPSGMTRAAKIVVVSLLLIQLICNFLSGDRSPGPGFSGHSCLYRKGRDSCRFCSVRCHCIRPSGSCPELWGHRVPPRPRGNRLCDLLRCDPVCVIV